jgi:phosphoglucomutase
MGNNDGLDKSREKATGWQSTKVRYTRPNVFFKTSTIQMVCRASSGAMVVTAFEEGVMKISPCAGKPAEASMLVNVPRLVTAYYTEVPDPSVPEQRVAFGTSGHRGSAFEKAFNEWHILAISQAICLYRVQQKIDGPLFLGMDTHALSVPALAGALEVLAANRVEVMLAEGDEYTPTPAVSHAILTYNRGRKTGLADGIGITPSHNPPHEGGFKYNPPNGGPAESGVTAWIGAKANEFLENGLRGVNRISFEKALRAPTTHRYDYLTTYITDLAKVLDMDVLRGAKISLGVDPLGGAGVHYWEPIAERYGLNLTVVNDAVDPTFRFMTMDWDGQIRMDPSSPYAMQRLIGMKDRFDLSFACDIDHDRHGIVTRGAGLLPPNHYLSVAIFYLFQHRPEVAQGGGNRQNGGEQPDDRSCRREAWPEALRGAGWLQVVRRGPARRFAWLRWRRERGSLLCSSGWHRLDDG